MDAANQIDRAKLEESLREAHRRTESILSGVSDTHIMFDREWRYIYVNDAAVRAIGRPREGIIGHILWELYPDLVGTEIDRQFHRAMDDGVPVSFEFHYLTRDRWWENRVNPVAEGVAVFATDISVRKSAEAVSHRSQQQLRALSAHLQTVREEERSRIAREIHDELGQLLTALKIELSLHELSLKSPGASPPQETVFRRMEGLIDQSIQTVRKIATELRPMVLDHLGLTAAIRWQAEEFLRASGIPCTLFIPDANLTLERDAATALFRIFQESLTNIARHAKASTVQVRLLNDARCTVLEVQDDGVGFSANAADEPASFGLLSMKERALMLGGTLNVATAPGEGTTITARVPHAAEGPTS